MLELKQKEVWFVTGSQHLYGADALARVAENAKKIAGSLSEADTRLRELRRQVRQVKALL